MKQTITSASNPKIKSLSLLRKDAKYRRSEELCLVTGKKMISELSAHNSIEILITTDPNPTLSAKTIYIVTSSIIKKITGVVSSDGYAACFRLPKPKLVEFKKALILDAIQDPGNLGTLFRSAQAFDFDQIILTLGSVDPFNEKVIRASKGAVFHVPYKLASIMELKDLQQKTHSNFILADMAGEDISKCPFTEPFAIILGNEGHGACQDLKNMSKIYSIYMNNQVESLNVGVCGSLMMYMSQKPCLTK